MEDLEKFLNWDHIDSVSGGFNNIDQYCLSEIILHYKLEVIVETGIFAGTSSVVILESLKKLGKGTLYSIDTNEVLGKWTGCLVTDDLKDSWHPLFNATSPHNLDKLSPETLNIDLFLHDSNHIYSVMMAEYDWAMKHINPGGWLLTHDFNRDRDMKISNFDKIGDVWEDFTIKYKRHLSEEFFVDGGALRGVRVMSDLHERVAG